MTTECYKMLNLLSPRSWRANSWVRSCTCSKCIHSAQATNNGIYTSLKIIIWMIRFYPMWFISHGLTPEKDKTQELNFRKMNPPRMIFFWLTILSQKSSFSSRTPKSESLWWRDNQTLRVSSSTSHSNTSLNLPMTNL